MLLLDLFRTLALTALAFMIGDLADCLDNYYPAFWAVTLALFTLIVGTAISMHRDEMRAYR